MTLARAGIPVGRALLAAALALAVAACSVPGGDGPQPGLDTSAAGETATSEDGTPTEGSTATQTPPGNDTDGPAPQTGGRNVLAWIADLGAGAPPGPEDEGASYLALSELRCGEALSLAGTRSAVKAAATACLAAQTGSAQLWESAVAQRAALPDGSEGCLDVGVLGALDRLLGAYAGSPGSQIVLRPDAAEGRPPCPTDITISPTSGPAGTPVTITGDHLEYVTTVIVDLGGGNVQQDFVELGQRQVTVTMPAPSGAATAEVLVGVDPNEWQLGRATFTFEPGTDPGDGGDPGNGTGPSDGGDPGNGSGPGDPEVTSGGDGEADSGAG
ncbi:IPT/TIG domain-containing protein [Georgenia yuyongxinii]|uniref:IPT/TIG domain-containing protein n=1 Tax=Georgenia yuyongxinii TaxID=2589797 RepID=A0A552WNE2_9MICO|nr:IPT/TIG domain-containing protein [Georgenia yuyongxinii]TRW44308.1 hypothetical protein FJ693_14055 [Georgenia yuyongxinii]